MPMARHTVKLEKYGRVRPGRNGQARLFWEPGPGLRPLGYKVERLYRPDGLPYTDHQIHQANEVLARINQAVAAGAEPSEIARIAAGSDGFVTLADPPRGPAAAGTLHDVIRRYKAHWRFGDLRASTKRVYLQSLDLLGRWAGDKPVAAIDGPLVQALYTELSGRPYVAHAAIRILRIVLEFAKRDLGYIAANPASDPGLKAPTAPDKRIWTPAEVAHMDATACRLGFPSMGLAIAANYWAVQRQGDVIALPKTAYRNGDIVVDAQSKTGARAIFPIDLVPELRMRLLAYLDSREGARAGRRIAATTLFVDDLTGRPWSGGSFYRQFKKIRAAAAKTMPSCADLQFKHLRHTGMTCYADAGVDSAGIAAISGHEIGAFNKQERILGTYIAKTREQAVAAVQKRLAYELRRVASAARQPK